MANELVKKRITEYGTEVTPDDLDNSDVIFVDSTQHGTRKLRLKGIRDIISGIQNEGIKSSGVSVTADNYATTITNVNNQPVNTIYAYAAGLQSSITNLPSNNTLNIMHYTYKYSVATNVGQVQIAIERSGEKPAMYFRTTGGTPVSWSSWVKMANNADIEAIREELNNLDIETDATLSISGKPADAKATGDAIDEVKADLGDVFDGCFDKKDIGMSNSKARRGISDTGLVAYDADKTVFFFPVSEGSLIYLNLSANTGTTSAIWEFVKFGRTEDASVDKIVGSVHFDAINAMIHVPNGALYVMISQPTGSTFYVQNIIPKDYQTQINNIAYGAYERLKGSYQLGSILNGVDSTTSSRIRHTKPVSYDRDIFIFVKSEYRFYIVFYSDAAGTTYLYTREFVTNNLPIIIKANTYFRIVICKTTEETVTDINTYVNALYITTQLFGNPQIYKNDLVRQVAHQGLSSNPSNTTGYCMVESYINAAKAGFTHGELDIVFSYDGVPFCCHDGTFTDATTSETVTIASKTAEELKTYNYHGGKIATFDEVVKTCKTYGMGVYVDHLNGTWTANEWNSLFAVIQKYNMAKNTFWLLPAVASVLTDPITTWYANANFVRVFTTAPSDFPTYVEAVGALKTDANIVSIDLPASAISANDMPTYTAQIPPGIELEIWTVDTVSDWYAYLPYASAITSNRICANIARQLT